jgi:DNA-binding GntR family transcriptional regulator
VTVLDEPAIRDIYRARRIIEIGVLHDVVDTGSVSAARTAVNEGLAARARGDVPAVTTANQHFHRAIVALAGSPSLDRLMTQMLAQIRLALHGAQSHRSFHEQFVDENNQLCLLLEQGRFGEAARAMESYLERSEQGVLEATRVR